MTKLDRLKAEARETATLRGHRLGKFQAAAISGEIASEDQRPGATAVCEICGALVVVDPAPPPGEPEVLGEGVNRDCTGIEEEWHETA